MSLFQPFPTGKGPVKALVYGEPGTEKTRRALKMPGPRFVIDLENGASDYGDLVDPKVDRYLATKSHAQVAAAVREAVELERRKPGSVGTLIVDPITVVWQSLQAGHIAKVVRKSGGKTAPEDVQFDVGAWGALKRLYGDLMTDILNAPFHCVLIARGADKVDSKGNKLGYGYDGEKSTRFLMKLVIETHSDHDIVHKDRYGAAKEGRHPRLDFSRFVGAAGTASVPMQSDSEADEWVDGIAPDNTTIARDNGERDNGDDPTPKPAPSGTNRAGTGGSPSDAPDPSWNAEAHKNLVAVLEPHGVTYQQLADFEVAQGRKRPSGVSDETRMKLAKWLVHGGGFGKLKAWVAQQASKAA
jgi:hypothetical protein